MTSVRFVKPLLPICTTAFMLKLGPCGSQTLHARTQTSPHGQCDGDVIDAEFALRRCHLSSTERIFFSFPLFAKNVAIDLKCIENHGGKPWLPVKSTDSSELQVELLPRLSSNLSQ